MKARSRAGEPVLRGADRRARHTTNSIRLLACLLPALVCGFVSPQTDEGQPRRWKLLDPDPWVSTNAVNPETRAIRFYLPTATYSAAQRAAELDAIRAAAGQWQSAPGTHLRFEEAGFLPPPSIVNVEDNHNTIFWAGSGYEGFDDLSGRLAVTYVGYFTDDNTIAEADTVINGIQYAWTPQDAPGSSAFSIEGIVLHELGHWVGLEHTPAGGALMLARGEDGSSWAGGLSSDDIAGIRTLYPLADFQAGLARLSGRVVLGGQGVLGALVFAEDSSGNLMAATATRASGAYSLPSLLPGQARVWISPLDPVSGLSMLTERDVYLEQPGAPTGFLPAEPVSVLLSPAQSQTVDFSLTAGAPAFRVGRIEPPPSSGSGSAPGNAPISLVAGQSRQTIGLYGVNLPAANASVSISGAGIALDPPVYEPNAFPGINRIQVTVDISPYAAPGMRTITIRQQNQKCYLSGFIEILPAIPDQDFDGLDDRFQRDYFAPFTSRDADPEMDPDRDGFSNLDEYVAGSIPTDALSVLRIRRIQPSGQGMALEWSGRAGATYQVWARSAGGAGEWSSLSPPFTATNANVSFLDPAPAGSNRFYQLHALP
ncbi:MAG TPA: matrixin family metalloprotease [Candidatus Paceibacterota bacterium]|nr:matrixin family metalloprotease [Verrucomicrobiota bacterium]HRZ46670.1 matrixin family metalloprotease [Candidatus Paceibacterota bacterium]